MPDFIVAPRRRWPAAAAMSVLAPIGLIFGRALGAAFFVDQRLPVSDRDLIVVGVNFAEGEEAVTVAAVIDERGLQ